MGGRSSRALVAAGSVPERRPLRQLDAALAVRAGSAVVFQVGLRVRIGEAVSQIRLVAQQGEWGLAGAAPGNRRHAAGWRRRTFHAASQLASQASASAKPCCPTMLATLQRRGGAGAGRRGNISGARTCPTCGGPPGALPERPTRPPGGRLSCPAHSLLGVAPRQLHQLLVLAAQHRPALGLHAQAGRIVQRRGRGQMASPLPP